MVEPTPLKNNSQNGNLPQLGVKMKNIWNHQLEDVNPAILMIPFPIRKDISPPFFVVGFESMIFQMGYGP